MADISKIKLPDNNTYNIKDSTGRKEAYLEWGGKNFSASYGCIDAAMISNLGANRFAFLKAAGITIEYSTNGGTTWTDYGATDLDKTGLFGKGSGYYLGKHSAAGSSTLNDMLRVTISTSSAGIYTYLNKIAIYMSTNGNTVQVLMEKALESTPTTYVTHLDWTGIAGWSGWNILNINYVTTYGNTAASQYGRIRFTFKQTAVNSGSYGAASISRIMGFGGVGWTVPSNMAADGHIYSYDNAQNATFPASIKIGIQNDGYGLLPSTNNYNQIGSSSLYWYRAFVTNYYGTTSYITNWKAGKNIGSPATSSAASELGSVNFYNSCAAGGTQTKTLLTADSSANSNITITLPKKTGTLALSNDIASTSDYGVTKLSTSTSSTSTALAATPSAVKAAYDLANTANGTAKTALSGVNGTLIYDHTYSISNGVATFTPHVYLKGEEVTTNYAATRFSWSFVLIDGSSVVIPVKDSTKGAGEGTAADRGCVVTISQHGYGGHVLGEFTPPA